jgi:hypothetical protein
MYEDRLMGLPTYEMVTTIIGHLQHDHPLWRQAAMSALACMAEYNSRGIPCLWCSTAELITPIVDSSTLGSEQVMVLVDMLEDNDSVVRSSSVEVLSSIA